MTELTPKERRALRARAHHLHPVVIVGHHGLTPQVLNEIDVALTAHGLIKVRVNTDDRAVREAMLARIADELHAAPVQHLGKLLVVWRARDEDDEEATAARHTARPSSAARPAQRPGAAAHGSAGKARGGPARPPDDRRRRGSASAAQGTRRSTGAAAPAGPARPPDDRRRRGSASAAQGTRRSTGTAAPTGGFGKAAGTQPPRARKPAAGIPLAKGPRASTAAARARPAGSVQRTPQAPSRRRRGR